MTRARLARLASLGLGVLLGVPAALGAQTIPSPYRHIEPAQAVGVFGGYLLTDRGEQGLGPASGPTIGLRYAGRFAAPVAGVVRLSATPSERTVFARISTDPEVPLTQVDETDATVLTAEAGLRLLLTGPRTWHSLAPYLEATGGLVSLVSSRVEAESQLPENQLVDFGPSFAVGLGAGTDWFLTERLSLSIAAQGLLLRQTTPEGLTGEQREQSEWTQNLGVTLGAAFHF